MTKDIAIVKEEVAPLLQTANVMEIKSAEDMDVAVAVLSKLNTIADGLEEDRLKITKPLNDSLREINARYKPVKDLLTNTIASVRFKIGSYQTKMLELRKETEEKLARRVEAGTLKMETAVKKLEALPVVDNSVDSEVGKVTFVEVEKFEVEDLSIVPIEFHMADEKKIREAMKEGMRLPGVRYWTEQSVRNTR